MQPEFKKERYYGKEMFICRDFWDIFRSKWGNAGEMEAIVKDNSTLSGFSVKEGTANTTIARFRGMGMSASGQRILDKN